MLDNAEPSQSPGSDNTPKLTVHMFRAVTIMTSQPKDFTFKSKCLHVENLNLRHLIPEVVEIWIILANEIK